MRTLSENRSRVSWKVVKRFFVFWGFQLVLLVSYFFLFGGKSAARPLNFIEALDSGTMDQANSAIPPFSELQFRKANFLGFRQKGALLAAATGGATLQTAVRSKASTLKTTTNSSSGSITSTYNTVRNSATNNASGGNITVAPPKEADLAIVDVTHAFTNQICTIKCVIQNVGTAPSRIAKAVLSEGNENLTADVGSLAPSNSFKVSFMLTHPLSAGNHTFRIRVALENSMRESNLANNSRSYVVSVKPEGDTAGVDRNGNREKLPDLAIGDVTHNLSSSICTIICPIQNLGNDVSRRVEVELRGNNERLTNRIESLKPDEATNVSFTLKNALAEGSYNFNIQIDRANRSREVNRDNNQKTYVVTVAPELVSVPNVVGQTLASARKILEGAGLVVSYPQRSGNSPRAIVEAQNPEAFTKVRLQTSVTLQLKSRWWISIIIVVVVVSGLVWGLAFMGRLFKRTPPQPNPGPPRVSVLTSLSQQRATIARDDNSINPPRITFRFSVSNPVSWIESNPT